MPSTIEVAYICDICGKSHYIKIRNKDLRYCRDNLIFDDSKAIMEHFCPTDMLLNTGFTSCTCKNCDEKLARRIKDEQK